LFITSVGQIQPMSLHPDIETFGELEILRYLKQMQNDPDKLLIDTRLESWYAYRTIPGAINIPHDHLSHAKSFPEGFKEALHILNIKQKKDGTYDFSQSKTIALFCNGSWCAQSPDMIKHLLQMGYPPQKIKWYRGGMHDWLMLRMTSTRK
ncbi:MAG: rhodanese-like domain-containing protein, partial [Sulfurovum sp.]|nr:rhodanese-like domain-containing protein [Sulfurovum sp.]